MDRPKRRRRRKGRGPANAPSQAPLQPAYPDMEREEPEEVNGNVDMVSELANETEVEEKGPPAANDANRGQQQQRNRRRRGRRGRPAPKPVTPVEATAVAPLEEAVAETQGEDAAVESVEPDAVPAAPVYAAPAKRTPKGVVVLAIGLPGSGKTSWFRRRGITPLSSDLLRMLLFDDMTEQRYQDLVFSTLRYLLRARMIARMPWNYVDATNLSPRERRGWIRMAQEFGYDVHAIFFNVPLEVCIDRNKRRGRVVPDDVMQRMAQKLRPPEFEEGFSKVTVVRVKKHEQAVEGGETPELPEFY
jgi:predicted kinase